MPHYPLVSGRAIVSLPCLKSMRNYHEFTVEELAQDDFFRESVHHPTPETNLFWDGFLKQYPEKETVVTTASAFLKAVANIQRIPAPELGERMWLGIQNQLHNADEVEPDNEPAAPATGYRWAWGAAAAVFLLIGFGWWFMTTTDFRDRSLSGNAWHVPMEKPLVQQENTTNVPLSVRLADGSQVILQPRSRIRYPKTFDLVKREVYLEGEGFFEVAHNTRQPFVIYTGKIVTQVVGTSFTIKALPETSHITVAVRTGKVAVFTLKALLDASRNQEKIAEQLLLMPNQQAIFDTRSERLTKRLVDEPALVKPLDSDEYFVFESVPLPEAFRKLEHAYGVSIQYDTTAFNHCNLTAPLGDEPLFRKLDIICQTIGATYVVWGTRIVVSGPGCEAP